MYFLNISIQRKHGIRQEKVRFYYFTSFVTLYLLERPWESSFSRRGGNKKMESSLRVSTRFEENRRNALSPLLTCGLQAVGRTLHWRGAGYPNLKEGRTVTSWWWNEAYQTLTWSGHFFHNLITLNCSFPGCLGCVHKRADVSADCLISNLQLAPKEQPAHCG